MAKKAKKRRINVKYDDGFPKIAKGICEVFYASDEELADCFDVTDKKFQRWKENHPELRKQMKSGRSGYQRGVKRSGGYRKGAYDNLAYHICASVGGGVKGLSLFFNVPESTIHEWLSDKENFLLSVYEGRTAYRKWQIENGIKELIPIVVGLSDEQG